MVLTARAVDSLYEVVGASVGGEEVNRRQLERLIEEAAVAHKKILPMEEHHTDGGDFVYKTPTKKKNPSVVMSSPVSVTADIHATEVVMKGFDHDFLDTLAKVFFETFSNYATPTVRKTDPHIPILLSIEGNIGAGKSTLLRALRESHPEWTFIDEPLNTWTALKNETGNLLECFYGDQDRWAYTFQNCSILSRYQLIENAIKEKEHLHSGKHIYITERSLGTDYHVFAKMLKDDGKLDEVEFDLYERWLAELEKTCTPLAGIVLVDTPPQVCSERIVKRSREGEDGIPLEYLENLHCFQSKWIENIDIPCRKTCTKEGIEEFVEYMLSR